MQVQNRANNSTERAMKNIKAFGKMVDREKAYQIIINDKMNEVVYARMYEMFEDLLMSGWQGLYYWTDKELEEYISELLLVNQPDGKI
jgi:hypothetical protein